MNAPPVIAAIGNKAVNENSLLSFTVTASDADGTVPTLSATGLPAGATFASGVFSWTPSYTASGTYNVTFAATDGVATTTQAIVITVNNVNRAPILSAIGTKSVSENTLLSFVLAATDPDGTTPTFSATGLPIGATLTGNTFSWKPTYTQAGTYAVTFTASDGALTASETITIVVANVNAPPVIATIGNKTVNENVALTFAVTASDVDGTVPTLSATGLPAGATFASGTFSWTPSYTQSGSYIVTFAATDGLVTTTQAISITVANVNRAPTMTSVGTKTVNEGALLSFTISASDPDGTTPTISVTGLPSGAALVTNAFSWTPSYSQAGSYSVTFTASDGMLTAAQVVPIVVANVNRAPVAANDSVNAISGSLAAFNVTTNDTDPDGDALTVTVATLPSKGTLVQTTVGGGAFTYLPIANYTGADGFTYSVKDPSGLLSTATVTFAITNPAPDVSFGRAVRFGNTGNTDEVTSVVTDNAGNTFIGGYFTGTIDFDVSPAVSNKTSGYYNDAYVTKMNANGTYGWTWTANGYYGIYTRAITVDGSGNLYVVGEFSGTVDFDHTAGTDSQVAYGWYGFITKVNADGSYGWTRRIHSTSGYSGTIYPKAVAADSAGDVYVTGTFATANVSFGSTTDLRTNVGNTDLFVVKLKTDGSYGWARTVGAASSQVNGLAIKVDGQGRIFVGGSFAGTVNFGLGAKTSVSGSLDAFVMQLKTDGSTNTVWTAGELYTDEVKRLVLASDGVFAYGNFGGTVYFDPAKAEAALTSTTDVGNFLTKVRTDGSYGGTKTRTSGSDIVSDASGNLYLVGSFYGTRDFDPGAGTDSKVSAGGSYDIFLQKWLLDGTYGWTKTLGTTTEEIAAAASVSATGDLFVAGTFNGTVDFDPSAATYSLTSAGYKDAYLLWMAKDPAAVKDSDGDTLADVLELSYGLNPNSAADALTDLDGDLLSNVEEVRLNLNPTKKDTDTDGIDDKYELNTYGLNPLISTDAALDADRDGVTNLNEYLAGTNINVADNNIFSRALTFGSTTNYDNVTSVALDGLGNTALAGYFSGTADFDPTAGVKSITSGSYYDAYASKLNADGSYAWTWNITNPFYHKYSRAITADSAGNVYVVGEFTGSVDFDHTAGADTKTGYGWNGFVTKINANGSYGWTRTFYSYNNYTGSIYPTAVTVDSVGAVYVSGNYGTASVTFGNTADLRSAASTSDLFVVKIKADGSYGWARTMGGSGVYAYGKSIKVDSSGRTYVAGKYYGTMDFGKGARASVGGSYDAYIAQLNTDGSTAWMWYSPDAGSDGINQIFLTTDAVQAVGDFYGTVRLDPTQTGPALVSTTDNSNFLLKISSAGVYTSSRVVPWNKAAGFDSAGNFYLVGEFYNSRDFNPGNYVETATSAGSRDIFVQKYFANGDYGWTKVIGGSGDDYPTAMALTGAGGLTIVGHFNGTVDFDPGVGVAARTSNGGQDVFVLDLKH